MNRVTQGKYPLGTVTGGLLLAELLNTRSLPPSILTMDLVDDLSDPNYCTIKPGKELSWGSMISAGCINSFSMLNYYLGANVVNNLYEQLGLVTLDEKTTNEVESELIDMDQNYEIGTASQLISPLQMAVAYAALSNGGTIISPKLQHPTVIPMTIGFFSLSLMNPQTRSHSKLTRPKQS